MTQQEKDELRQEMLEEAREEEYTERLLRTDFNYIIEKVADDFELQEAYEKFKKAADMLSEYGWEMSPLDVFKEM